MSKEGGTCAVLSARRVTRSIVRRPGTCRTLAGHDEGHGPRPSSGTSRAKWRRGERSEVSMIWHQADARIELRENRFSRNSCWLAGIPSGGELPPLERAGPYAGLAVHP